LIADKMLKALHPHYRIEGQDVVVTGCVGIALYPDHGADSITLIQKADQAMYAAKRTGKNVSPIFLSATEKCKMAAIV
jgi:predicted signal transduction protein with EAL and GGDEF domain